MTLLSEMIDPMSAGSKPIRELLPLVNPRMIFIFDDILVVFFWTVGYLTIDCFLVIAAPFSFSGSMDCLVET
jgi:hypothetical protein